MLAYSQRFEENVQFTLARVIARNKKPCELLVPVYSTRPEALCAIAALLRIPQDIIIALLTVLGSSWLNRTILSSDEWNGNDLVARGAIAVP